MKFTSIVRVAALAGATVLMTAPAFAVTLNLHNGGDPRSLDPQRVSGNWEDRPVSDYIEGLMTIDAEGNAILGQAASYQISDDQLVYTFTLRDDAIHAERDAKKATEIIRRIG